MVNDLPAYRYIEGKRFYLTISADVYGRWNVGYGVVLPTGQFMLSMPLVNDAATIEDGCARLAAALRDSDPGERVVNRSI